MIGQKFNRWKVLEDVGTNKWGDRLYKCQCECGIIKNILGTRLRKNRSKSCNCLQKEITRNRVGLPEGVSERNRIIRRYKRCAKDKGVEYLLDDTDFITITSSPCFYCGISPSPFAKGSANSNGAFVGNGIDRVDNTKGYIRSNVVSCCTQCNWAKNIQSQNDFYKWAIRFYNHNKEKFL